MTYPFEIWAQLHEGEIGVVGSCAVLSFGAAHAIALRGCARSAHIHATQVFRQSCTHSRMLAHWQRAEDAQQEILKCSLIPVHGRDSKQRLFSAVHDFAKVCLRLREPRNIDTRAFCPATDQPGMSLHLPPCLLRATPRRRKQIRSHTTAPNCNGKRAKATDGTRSRIPVSDRIKVVCIMVQCVVGYDFTQRLNHQFTIRKG